VRGQRFRNPSRERMRHRLIPGVRSIVIAHTIVFQQMAHGFAVLDENGARLRRA